LKQFFNVFLSSLTPSLAAMKKSIVQKWNTNSLPRRRVLTLLFTSGALSALSACGAGGGGSAGTASDSTLGLVASAATDITAAITLNQNVTLAGDSIIRLPAGVTTYTGVISGQGTLTLASASGSASTLVITQTSTFTLPPAQQVQTVAKVVYPGAGYALNITGSNPPVLTVNPGVTLQIGTNSAADNHPNILATSDSKNLASVINNEINLNNILNNGTIVLKSAHFILLGQIAGSGHVLQPPDVWGGNSMGGVNNFEGVLSLSAGHDFGTNHVAASVPKAKAILNEGSFLVWSPPGSTVKISQTIYEASFGGDINFHPIGNSTIVMSGIYSHTDNSPHNSPNLVNPSLSDPSLNLAKVIYRGGPNDINGNDGSYRGINIEPAAPSNGAMERTAISSCRRRRRRPKSRLHWARRMLTLICTGAGPWHLITTARSRSMWALPAVAADRIAANRLVWEMSRW
jgi:hypothetical protein